VEEVVLFTDGQDTTREQIVDAWRTLRRHLPWLPQWFAAVNVQDIMEYLLGCLPVSILVNVFQLRMAASESAGENSNCYVLVSIAGELRVVIGSSGSAGVPDVQGGGGAVYFHWRPGRTNPREMLMTIYCAPPPQPAPAS
jgi:hypothetical protein